MKLNCCLFVINLFILCPICMDCFVLFYVVLVLLLFLLHGFYLTRNAFLNFVTGSDCWLCCWHWRPCCWHWLLAMLLTLTVSCFVDMDWWLCCDGWPCCWLWLLAVYFRPVGQKQIKISWTQLRGKSFHHWHCFVTCFNFSNRDSIVKT